MILRLAGSIREGYRFGLGLQLASAQAELIEAEADADTAEPEDNAQHRRTVDSKKRQLKAWEDLVESVTREEPR